mmetsp:Transcript_18022/g.27008  ORF Transcript_18022/g.27008 Transcript_18022/m.27008 type:complete len:339 (+) Transcript_18022:158-1174(+)|eukprot:CAMPEP_0167757574 /NCGR_PEP_ID=MMETSP0110_2-20121227/9998_1 /TAXON_ID=629695 /ORGANISM="Gymnochlora sp., Strain CCMP2014" /LENGTH=338 /DNA_ID=CAMNT_0007643773 /DNA_START=65 /DNA_END=1081 /DNA_ORIENTATION=+
MSKIVVGKCYQLGKKISSGSFGDVYYGVNTLTNTPVAIKLENRKTPVEQLLFEGRVYKLLKGGLGIPHVHWCGKEGDFNVMVMDLLGSTLQELLDKCGGKFSLKTTLMLVLQMISRVEYLHSKNLVHRDIKPENFVIGLRKRRGLVYMIDFGLAKKYRHHKTKEHIEYAADKKSLTGTARYASINSHAGVEQSRRDDMESLGYVFVYLVKGKLPWQGIQAQTKSEKYELIRKMKESTPVSTICEGLPDAFAKYLKLCRELGFKATPKYSQLKGLFTDLMKKKGYEMDFKYDWRIEKKDTEKKKMTSKKPIPKPGDYIPKNKSNKMNKGKGPREIKMMR